MWTPWLGVTIGFTSGSSIRRTASAKTPVALTTAFAGISNASPDSASCAAAHLAVGLEQARDGS